MEVIRLNLLDLVIKEYIGIVRILEKQSEIQNNRIIIEREKFKEMLERYAYMTFAEKTKIYKALNLIIHDNNNYTMPYKDPILKKTIRKVIINYKTYQTLKYLFETKINY